ncbi:MAG: hypothetical protein PHR45_02005 [Muribaculaceae bacterium]|nr:hypothetical protein [Muribaculaceae bacterium]
MEMNMHNDGHLRRMPAHSFHPNASLMASARRSCYVACHTKNNVGK